ncbi:MAG TPA: hypothetical protein VN674_11975 [Gemmatimonadales bacterium]|nr:hypothetical protein [Gemmatimonadales bacterium]
MASYPCPGRDPVVDVVRMNAASLAGLALFVGLTLGRRFQQRWAWVLTGIYLLGPAAMVFGASFTRLPGPHIQAHGEALVGAVILLFPPMTLWIAGDTGMLIAVLVATVILGVLAARQRGDSQPDKHLEPSRRMIEK